MNTLGWVSFFPPFFASFSLFHAVLVLLLSLKGHIPPQMFKKQGGDFFWILYTICQTRKRGQKGRKKGYCEQP
jgi:hypothetical protein